MRHLIQSSSGNRRTMVLIAAILALFTLFPLVSGLESVDLKPAERHWVQEEDLGDQSALEFPATVSDVDPGAQTFVRFFIVAMFAIMIVIFLRKASKRILKNVLSFVVQLLIMYVILTYFYTQPQEIDASGPPAPYVSVGLGNDGVPVEFIAPEVPQWFVFSVIFFTLFVAGAIGWLAWYFLRPQEPTLDQDLTRIARRTLQDLESGRHWSDAVIRCYAEMSEAFDHHRGITRSRSMTPTEFISYIDRHSMPVEPVRTLTRLFEQARYGGRSSGPEETSEAMNCLNQIIASCTVKP